MNDDLNDLRLVAAITETGSLSGAARRLRLNHATVFRRIEAFERRLGAKLFERRAGRYIATVVGEELARAGALIVREATDSLRRVAGHDLRPAGLVRITTTDSIAHGLVGPMVRNCHDAHPGITVQVSVTGAFYDLSKGDADIAIRPTNRPPEHLIGKKVGVIAMAVYGSRDYLHSRRGRSLAEHDWVAVDDSLGHSASLAWLSRFKRLEEVLYRTNSFVGVREACAAGIGLAVLPCFIGDVHPTLERASDPVAECANDVWILTHPDLRDTVRVKSVYTELVKELGKAAALMAGKLPASGARKGSKAAGPKLRRDHD